MAPKKKGKNGKKEAAGGSPGPAKHADMPADPAAWVLGERLARMHVKVVEAEAGHTDVSGRLEQNQEDNKEVFAHLERELAQKTEQVAALEARVRLLQEENGMQSMLADRRLASQQEAYETEIARLKRDHDTLRPISNRALATRPRLASRRRSSTTASRVRRAAWIRTMPSSSWG